MDGRGGGGAADAEGDLAGVVIDPAGGADLNRILQGAGEAAGSVGWAYDLSDAVAIQKRLAAYLLNQLKSCILCSGQYLRACLQRVVRLGVEADALQRQQCAQAA